MRRRRLREERATTGEIGERVGDDGAGSFAEDDKNEKQDGASHGDHEADEPGDAIVDAGEGALLPHAGGGEDAAIPGLHLGGQVVVHMGGVAFHDENGDDGHGIPQAEQADGEEEGHQVLFAHGGVGAHDADTEERGADADDHHQQVEDEGTVEEAPPQAGLVGVGETPREEARRATLLVVRHEHENEGSHDGIAPAEDVGHPFVLLVEAVLVLLQGHVVEQHQGLDQPPSSRQHAAEKEAEARKAAPQLVLELKVTFLAHELAGPLGAAAGKAQADEEGAHSREPDEPRRILPQLRVDAKDDQHQRRTHQRDPAKHRHRHKQGVELALRRAEKQLRGAAHRRAAQSREWILVRGHENQRFGARESDG